MTIENGCDFDDFAGLEHHAALAFASRMRGASSAGATRGRFSPRSPTPARMRRAIRRRFPRRRPRVGGDARSWRPAGAARVRAHQRALELQRDSEALLLLIPEAGGRGKGVLSGKVFEYLAAERPILAAVPPDGAAAALIRETGAGIVASPDDPQAIGEALRSLHDRW